MRRCVLFCELPSHVAESFTNPVHALIPPTDPRLDPTEISRIIKRCHMPARQAEAFKMALRYPYMSEAEIGESMGITQQAVHGHLQDAQECVRRWRGCGNVGVLTLAIRHFPMARVREIIRG